MNGILTYFKRDPNVKAHYDNSLDSKSWRYVTKRQAVTVAVVWLGLPLVIFLLTWVRPIIGWPLSVGVVLALVMTIKNLHRPDEPIVSVNWRFMVVVGLVLLYTIYSGIGGLFYQDLWDHAFRNAVFSDLVNNAWPVIQDNPVTGRMEMLCYYHGFWLPAALVSKITGSIGVGYAVQFVYAFIGLLLTSIVVYRILEMSEASVWVLLVLTLYCGWDVVLYIMEFNVWPRPDNLRQFYVALKDWHFYYFSAPSFCVLTLYVYNQGIAALLGSGLLWILRYNFGSIVLLYSLIFIFAPIPAVGLLPVVTYWTLRRVKASFTWENVVGVLVFAVVGLYFLSNNRARYTTCQILPFSEYVWKCGLFLMFSYVIYFPYIWKSIKGNMMFWIMFCTAIVIPYFSMGGASDLGARAGAPFSFFMAMLVIKALARIKTWPKYKAVALIATLVIGAVSTSGVYTKHFVLGYRTLRSGLSFRQGWIPSVFDTERCPVRDNFVAEESMFTRHIMSAHDKESVASFLNDEPESQQ